MTLLAEDIDDVGEIGFGGPGDHIGRGRTVMAHPHVERAAEPEREAALGLIELHRGDADVHHDAVDGVDALRGADLGQIGEAVLDQGQPAIGAIDQIEAAGNRGPVAVDADDPGSLRFQDRAAVAAGAEGGVDIDAAVAGSEHLDRLAAEHGNMAWRQPNSFASPGRIPACGTGTGRQRAHCASNLCALPGFSGQKATARRDRRSRPQPANPDFRTEFVGLPWDFERETGLGRPQNRFGSSPLSNGT